MTAAILPSSYVSDVADVRWLCGYLCSTTKITSNCMFRFQCRCMHANIFRILIGSKRKKPLAKFLFTADHA